MPQTAARITAGHGVLSPRAPGVLQARCDHRADAGARVATGGIHSECHEMAGPFRDDGRAYWASSSVVLVVFYTRIGLERQARDRLSSALSEDPAGQLPERREAGVQ